MVSANVMPRGSSPLTRGKRVGSLNDLSQIRLIPAHAGKTAFHARRRPVRQAHPRSRGENAVNDPHSRTAYGSSPLTRGKLSRVTTCDSHKRLIPAHAGKTTANTRMRSRSAAHPRSRGENG